MDPDYGGPPHGRLSVSCSRRRHPLCDSSFSVKTGFRICGSVLIAAAFAPLSLHAQSADSLGSDHPVPDCGAREAGNARSFDKSRPEVLVGRYGLTMVSAWEEAAGRWSRGELEIWRTPGGKIQGASNIDLDSLEVPGHPIDDPFPETLGSGDLASRDTLSPGLVYDSFGGVLGLLLASVLGADRSQSWLEVDSLSDGGFWGRWDSDLGMVSLADKDGRILANPHGTFCAVSIRESDGAGAGTDQRRNAVVATADLFAADDSPSVQCDPSYVGVCIPPPPPDLDCSNISERGFRVVGDDPHRLDRDRDGYACEEG
ncbi:hypothetical protein BH20GEM1_BH20GEM1_20770 [soil metagenome]